MTLHFLKKEFLESILGPKFLITFAICTVLVLTSLFTGYELYRAESSWYARAKNENIRALESAGGYAGLKNRGTKTLREPSRMAIFVKGVDSSIGRASMVSEDPSIVLRDSRFGLNPILAMFGELDLAFMVKMILSLFAILFSYNAISGERELGTLKQVMSYPVGKAAFIVGKTLGGLITLLLTFVIPLLIGLLLLMFFFGVSFTGDEWGRIGMLTLVFSLYLTVFYLVGMFMSALTRNSFVSFLLSLFVWVMSIILLPMGAVELANQISPAPSIDTVEAERAALTKEYFRDLKSLTEQYFKENYKGDPREFGNVFRKAMDQGRGDALAKRREREEPLLMEYERAQMRLLSTAEAVSRISPTASLTIAANRIAHTHATLQDRFLTALRKYRETYLDYADDLARKDPEKQGGGIQVAVENENVSIRVPDYDIALPGFPQFTMAPESLAESVNAVLLDIGLLCSLFILLFAGSFIAFLRYDVR